MKDFKKNCHTASYIDSSFKGFHETKTLMDKYVKLCNGKFALDANKVQPRPYNYPKPDNWLLYAAPVRKFYFTYLKGLNPALWSISLNE